MGGLDVWLLLYIRNPGLYDKNYIHGVNNAIRRKLKPGKIVLWICSGEEYHYTLRLIRWLNTFDLKMKNCKYGLQSLYV